MEIMTETPWSKIRGQNSVDKGLLEIVGSGKPTGSVLKETIVVFVTISIACKSDTAESVSKFFHASEWKKCVENPKSQRKVPVVECVDGLGRITSAKTTPHKSIFAVCLQGILVQNKFGALTTSELVTRSTERQAHQHVERPETCGNSRVHRMTRGRWGLNHCWACLFLVSLPCC